MNPVPRLVLTDDLTIYNAATTKEQLLGALTSSDAIELDLSQVGQIDTSGLQLLVLVKQESVKSSKRLNIIAHSPAVRQAIDFCNLASFFGDPVVITAREEV